MRACEGKPGRVFVMRLEDGDVIPDCIEQFADEKGIKTGQALLVGGIGEGQVVTGPRYSNKMPPEPMLLPVDGAHEVLAVGVLAPDDKGKPVLHILG
jgi:predicted DNA-binding protein with PD1-like motif